MGNMMRLMRGLTWVHEVHEELELLVPDVGEHDGGVLAGGHGQHLLQVAGAGAEQHAVGADNLDSDAILS